jgi:DNA-binding transcriptional ArsR family regulator
VWGFPSSAAREEYGPLRICKITDCAKPVGTGGMCWKHYNRLRFHGDPCAEPQYYRDPVEALRARTNRSGPIPEARPELGPCWLWTGSHNGKYGKLSVDKRLMYAHRFAYEVHKGAIPDGHVIDHLCRVRLCVNPDHLEPVTNAENIERGAGSDAVRQRQAAILAHLGRCPEATRIELAAAIGASVGTTSTALARLVRNGSLTRRQIRQNRVLYSLPGPAKSAKETA